MGKEIEYKFLVNKGLILPKLDKEKYLEIKQGYITNSTEKVVRVRTKEIITKRENYKVGYLTIKGANKGITRSEYEYEIPYDEAVSMLEEFCDTYIEKTRYIVLHKGKTWEIDFFEGDNSGLIIAELEVESEEETFEKPEWIGEDVSLDKRYLNNNLIKTPYTKW